MDESQKSKNKNKQNKKTIIWSEKIQTQRINAVGVYMEVQGQAKLIYGDRGVVITSGRRSTKCK